MQENNGSALLEKEKTWDSGIGSEEEARDSGCGKEEEERGRMAHQRRRRRCGTMVEGQKRGM